MQPSWQSPHRRYHYNVHEAQLSGASASSVGHYGTAASARGTNRQKSAGGTGIRWKRQQQKAAEAAYDGDARFQHQRRAGLVDQEERCDSAATVAFSVDQAPARWPQGDGSAVPYHQQNTRDSLGHISSGTAGRDDNKATDYRQADPDSALVHASPASFPASGKALAGRKVVTVRGAATYKGLFPTQTTQSIYVPKYPAAEGQPSSVPVSEELVTRHTLGNQVSSVGSSSRDSAVIPSVKPSRRGSSSSAAVVPPMSAQMCESALLWLYLSEQLARQMFSCAQVELRSVRRCGTARSASAESQQQYRTSSSVAHKNLLEVEFVSHVQSLLVDICPAGRIVTMGSLKSKIRIPSSPLSFSWDVEGSRERILGSLHMCLRKQQYNSTTNNRYLFRSEFRSIPNSTDALFGEEDETALNEHSLPKTVPYLAIWDLVGNCECEIHVRNYGAQWLARLFRLYSESSPIIHDMAHLLALWTYRRVVPWVHTYHRPSGGFPPSAPGLSRLSSGNIQPADGCEFSCTEFPHMEAPADVVQLLLLSYLIKTQPNGALQTPAALIGSQQDSHEIHLVAPAAFGEVHDRHPGEPTEASHVTPPTSTLELSSFFFDFFRYYTGVFSSSWVQSEGDGPGSDADNAGLSRKSSSESRRPQVDTQNREQQCVPLVVSASRCGLNEAGEVRAAKTRSKQRMLRVIDPISGRDLMAQFDESFEVHLVEEIRRVWRLARSCPALPTERSEDEDGPMLHSNPPRAQERATVDQKDGRRRGGSRYDSLPPLVDAIFKTLPGRGHAKPKVSVFEPLHPTACVDLSAGRCVEIPGPHSCLCNSVPSKCVYDGVPSASNLSRIELALATKESMLREIQGYKTLQQTLSEKIRALRNELWWNDRRKSLSSPATGHNSDLLHPSSVTFQNGSDTTTALTSALLRHLFHQLTTQNSGLQDVEACDLPPRAAASPGDAALSWDIAPLPGNAIEEGDNGTLPTAAGQPGPIAVASPESSHSSPFVMKPTPVDAYMPFDSFGDCWESPECEFTSDFPAPAGDANDHPPKKSILELISDVPAVFGSSSDVPTTFDSPSDLGPYGQEL